MSKPLGSPRKLDQPQSPCHYVNPAVSPAGPEEMAADRVHPLPDAKPPPAEWKRFPSGTYVVQLPKDQIYRVPTPDHAARFEAYTRNAVRRQRCACFSCLACLLLLALTLALAVAAAAGGAYLAIRPERPVFSADRLAVAYLNVNPDQPLAGKFEAALRADNPNGRIAIFYLAGGSLTLSFDGVAIADGVWPAFRQPCRNVTVVETALVGNGVRLSAVKQRALKKDQQLNAVPLTMEVRAPVRIMVGGIMSWAINVRVLCEITVDRLTADGRIVSEDCRTGVYFF